MATTSNIESAARMGVLTLINDPDWNEVSIKHARNGQTAESTFFRQDFIDGLREAFPELTIINNHQEV